MKAVPAKIGVELTSSPAMILNISEPDPVR